MSGIVQLLKPYKSAEKNAVRHRQEGFLVIDHGQHDLTQNFMVTIIPIAVVLVLFRIRQSRGDVTFKKSFSLASLPQI